MILAGQAIDSARLVLIMLVEKQIVVTDSVEQLIAEPVEVALFEVELEQKQNVIAFEEIVVELHSEQTD